MKTTKDMPAGQHGKEEKMNDFVFQEKAARKLLNSEFNVGWNVMFESS